MKVESKIKMLTASLITAFVLIILFIAIQIGQERRMYQIEKRLDKIENILFAEAKNGNLLPDYHNIGWFNDLMNYKIIDHDKDVGSLHWKLNYITNSLELINKKLNSLDIRLGYRNIATVDPTDRNDWSTHYRVGQIRDTTYEINATLKNIDRKLDYRTINVNNDLYQPNIQEIKNYRELGFMSYNEVFADYLDKILKEVTYIRKFK